MPWSIRFDCDTIAVAASLIILCADNLAVSDAKFALNASETAVSPIASSAAAKLATLAVKAIPASALADAAVVSTSA